MDTAHSGHLATSFSESGIMKVDQIFSGVDAFEKSELEAFCSAAFLINIWCQISNEMSTCKCELDVRLFEQASAEDTERF